MTWVFTPGYSRPSDTKGGARQQQLSPRGALTHPQYTSEEKQVLSFFTTKIAPWLGDHGPLYARDYWVSTLPRSFHVGPATKHLLIAVGLLEQPMALGHDTLVSRCQRIQHHYTRGTTALTQPDVHPLDIALGPMLAWVLEARTGNDAAAGLHAAAIAKLSRTPTIGDISQYELDTVAQAMVRSQQLLAPTDDVPVALAGVYDSLVLRNRPCPAVDAGELLERFERYYVEFYPDGMTVEQVQAAESFVRNATVELLANAYKTDAAMVVFSALHFLCLLSMQLLPKPAVYTGVLSVDPVVVGVDYILEQCEDMRLRVLPKKAEAELLQRTVNLMIRVMIDHGPAGWVHQRRQRLARARIEPDIHRRTVIIPRVY